MYSTRECCARGCCRLWRGSYRKSTGIFGLGLNTFARSQTAASHLLKSLCLARRCLRLPTSSRRRCVDDSSRRFSDDTLRLSPCNACCGRSLPSTATLWVATSRRTLISRPSPSTCCFNPADSKVEARHSGQRTTASHRVWTAAGLITEHQRSLYIQKQGSVLSSMEQCSMQGNL